MVHSCTLTFLTYLILAALVLTGCHVEKRIHKPGYYSTWNHQLPIKRYHAWKEKTKKPEVVRKFNGNLNSTEYAAHENNDLKIQDSTSLFSLKDEKSLPSTANEPISIANSKAQITNQKNKPFTEPEPETPYDKRIKRSLYHFLIGSACYAIGMSITFTIGSATGITALMLVLAVVGGFFVGIIGLGVLLIAIRKRNWYRTLAKNSPTFGFTHHELQLNDPFRKFGIAVLKIFMAIITIIASVFIITALWSL